MFYILFIFNIFVVKKKQLEEIDYIGNYNEAVIKILFLKGASGSSTHYVVDMYRDNGGTIKFTHDLAYENDPNFYDPLYL